MSTNLRASDLLRDEHLKKKMRKENYKVQYQKCLNSIKTLNAHCHNTFTIHTIPVVLMGDPNYNMDECILYIKEELKKGEFHVRLMQPGNALYISWSQKDVEKVRKKNEKEREKERTKRLGFQTKETDEKSPNNTSKNDEHTTRNISVNPNDPLSRLFMKTTLMSENPKYSKMKSMKSYKQRNG